MGEIGTPGGPRFARHLFDVLRPYGGTACFELSPERHEQFARDVQAANLAGAKLQRHGRWTLLAREGSLPGSDDWTHQYGTAAQTFDEMRGPGRFNIDMSLRRTFKIRERWNLEFAANCTNLLNNTQLSANYSGAGTDLNELRVEFVVGDKVYKADQVVSEQQDFGGGRYQVGFKVPRDIAVGQALILA